MAPSCRAVHLFCLILLSTVSATVQGLISYSVVEGESLSLFCNLTENAFYTWYKDGEVQRRDSVNLQDIVISGVDDGRNLTIVRADRHIHPGIYNCNIASGPEESYTVFNISVYYLDSGISVHRTYPECIPNNDDKMAYFGGAITLDCLPPQGNPPVTISWFKGPPEHSQELHSNSRYTISSDGQRLMFGPLQMSDSDYYVCRASNEVNRSVDSLPFALEVIDGDSEEQTVSISGSGSTVVVGAGHNINITCHVLPNSDNVLWLHNSKLINYNQSRSHHQSPHPEQDCINTLQIESFSLGMVGIYECRETHSATHDQIQLSLAVLDGPLVVQATPTNHLARGKTMTLSCGLNQTADLNRNNIPVEDFTYSWTHNGTAVYEEDGDVEMVEGGRQLVFPAVTVSHSGVFICTVSSPEFIATSISASLSLIVEVEPLVKISLLGLGSDSLFDRIEMNTVYVQLGGYVSLQCTVESSTPSNFTWLKMVEGESELEEVYKSTSLSHYSIHSLRHLNLSDLTSYYCLVSNPVHQVRSGDIILTETMKSYVRDAAAGPQKIEFDNGTLLELNCEGRNARGEDLVWLYNDVIELNNSTSSQVVVVGNGSNSTLVISEVTTRDVGTYACVLRGTESRLTYDVIILVPARIEWTSEPDVTVVIGDTVRFDCVASGIPAPIVKWLFDTQPVEEVDSLQDLGNGSLRISMVTQDHDGSYHCFLANGAVSQKFTLTVSDSETEESINCGGDFSSKECMTLLAGGSIALFLLLLTVFILVCCICVLCHRYTKVQYNIPSEYEMKRALSSRASSHKEAGPTHTLAELNGSTGDGHGFRNGLYPSSHHPPFSSYHPGTALADMQRSVTPPAPSPVLRTPGTGGTDSMFSSDDQSSLTATLPNYPRSKLTLEQELGEGEFGPVILGVARNIVSHEETTQVVVKVLVRSGDGEDHFQPDLALVDFAHQMRIDYEHIACILGLCTDMEPYYVIYEYLDQGDLKKYLQTNRPVGESPSPLSPHILSRLVLQVADGMAFLFSQRIIHGDLAARNCLISSDNHIKIADLGIGHDLYQTDYYDNGTQLLPIRWMPPELLVATDDSPAFSLHSDVWSFGVLCWEVFTYGELPFEGVADEEVLREVPQGLTLSLPPSPLCPHHLTQAITHCWLSDPDSRPRFSTLCMEMNVISGD